MENIRFLDTTLRDGEQTPGVALTKEDKLAIARKLDELGVHIIEAGSAITSEGERESIRAIAAEGLSADICSYCRIMHLISTYALACDVDSIHLVAPVSDLHISSSSGRTRSGNADGHRDHRIAREHGLIVELSGEDASWADLDSLSPYTRQVSLAGAERSVLDPAGLLVPERQRPIQRSWLPL